jgi:putative ABC transport system permease protein
MFTFITDAIRLVRHRPGFCGSVAGITALSIGACTAIFSIVIAVLFPRWPFVEPERLAVIWHAQGDAPGVVGLSPGDFAAYRDATRSFELIAALSTRGFNLGGVAEPARVTCARATPELFPMLGVAPREGRWFTADDDRASNRVVVVSDRLWQTRFGSDDGLVGRSVMLNAVPYTVIGIMPEEFSFPPAGLQGTSDADCWLPASFTAVENATPSFDYVVVGKLKPGVSASQAASDVATQTRRIWESYPAAVQAQVNLRSRVVPLVEQVVAASRAPLALFAGSVLLLLLIGCANVSNLMLTRFTARQREMAVRAALGATRRVLVLQLLAESVALALAGALGGVLLAQGLVTATVALAAGAFPRLEHARVDAASLAFALVCAMLAGVLSGVAPALRSRRTGAAAMTAGGERNVSGSFRHDRLRSALVIAEIAMAVVVLAAAGLLVRSVINLNRVDAGFNPRGALTFSVALPPAAYPRAEAVDQFTRAVVDRLSEVPGVSAAAAGSGLPVGRTEVAVVSVPGSGSGAPEFKPAALQAVTAGYDTAFGMTITRGRAFTANDTLAGLPVAVVSAGMARSYWPGTDVIGKTVVRLGDARPLTIVGVMADVRQAGLDRSSPPTLYVPIAQAVQPVHTLAFVVRTTADSAQVAPHVRQVLAGADASLPMFGLRTGDDLLAASTSPRRFNMFVVVTFAAFAACLAVTGLYALLAYMVAQSSREFGVRMAMGAPVASIAGLVARRALVLLVPGVLVGAGVAAGLSRFAASLLFGVQPNDPTTIGLVALSLLAVSSAAVMVPAIRAARVDPLACLRHE